MHLHAVRRVPPAPPGRGRVGVPAPRPGPGLPRVARPRPAPAGRAAAPAAPRGAPPRAALALAALTAALGGGTLAALVAAIEAWTPGAIVAVALAVPAVLWLAGGAATAVIGLGAARPPARPPKGWRPEGRVAVLLTLCGEPPGPVAARLRALRADLDRTGLGAVTEIFVLSDTPPDRAAGEARVFAPLVAAGALRYRRRTSNTGRKPGNIAEWHACHGAAFDAMLILDSDSRMRADRIATLLWRMDRAPGLGLVQAAMRLAPARTGFGRWQRTAARLLGPAFVRGFAAWTGESGNYWGHNALIRTEAYAAAARLPRLTGRAPLGGALLSHDFVEAALIRRAGWQVRVDPALDGSAEEGPQTLAEFHRRDRRWCQGNLQHLRVLPWPGLAAPSRLHLAAGVLGYLAAPLWLALLALTGSGAVPLAGGGAALAVLALLLLPKVCGAALWLGRARTPGRRRVVLRAALGEAAVSAVVAPLVMLRQTGAVAAVLSGRDCGWRPAAAPGAAWPAGWPEAMSGVALAAGLLALNPGGAVWVLPAVAPLLAAPVLVPALDRVR